MDPSNFNGSPRLSQDEKAALGDLRGVASPKPGKAKAYKITIPPSKILEMMQGEGLEEKKSS